METEKNEAACGASLSDAGFGTKWRKIHTPGEQEEFYLSILPSIRTVARVLGFAIGVHGSLRRDLDLIAVPWRDGYATKDALAKAVQYAACGIKSETVTWHEKPCGRVATSLPICWTADKRPSAGHIDLSVMMPNNEVRGAKERSS